MNFKNTNLKESNEETLKSLSSPINDISPEKKLRDVENIDSEVSTDGSSTLEISESEVATELNTVDFIESCYEDTELEITEVPTDLVKENEKPLDLLCSDIETCIDWMKKNKGILNEFGISGLSDELLDYLLIQYHDEKNIEKIQQNFKAVDYGIKVDVNGHKMSVNIKGEEHNTTIVVLPGLGIQSPILFYKRLTEMLANDYKVVTIEPFGYGVSDSTEEERTTENMVSEIHICLQKLGIDQFYFMGHSLGGIYSILYDNTFKNEVLGFIGLDNTPSNFSDDDTPIPEDAYTFFKILDKYHLWGLLPEDKKKEFMEIEHEQQYQNYTEKELEDLLNINSYRYNNPIIIDECNHSGDSMASTKGLYFHCPLLMFISEQTQEHTPEWNTLHENMIKDNPNKEIINKSKVIPLEGTTHGFIHAQKKDFIYDEIKQWIN